MSHDAVLRLKQLHLTLFYKISESSYIPPHQYARKTQSNAVSRYQPRFHAECSTVFRKTPLKGGFPLSRNFYVRTDVNFNWLYVRKLK